MKNNTNMKVRKEKIGYIILTHDYGFNGSMSTQPTGMHGQRLTITEGLNTIPPNSELKNYYPIYVKYPSNKVVLNITDSNKILESQGKLYRSVIHCCSIPKGANVEKFVGGHMTNEKSKLFLSDKVIISIIN